MSANAGAQGFEPLQSIHIISHGSEGRLLLGSTTLTGSNLSLYSKQLASLGNALTENSDILLYGCNVAADQAGLQFINQLADLTHADVAASNDITGSAALGGDWQLEAATGTIESSLALSTATLDSYTDIFALGGIVITAFSGGFSISNNFSIAMQTDGKILLSGTDNTNNFVLVRYNSDGSLDTSFDSDGKITTNLDDVSSKSVIVQADGKILLGGQDVITANSVPVLARYNSNGSLDTSFGTPVDDTTAPTITTFSPTDDSASAGVSDNIILTFDEAIQKGKGNIILMTSAGKTVQSFNIATSTAISISGDTLTLSTPAKT